jgi:DNA-binding NarL/FixJ family response regulator
MAKKRPGRNRAAKIRAGSISKRSAGHVLKGRAGYWQKRLLQRTYPATGKPGAAPDWSVRIEHDGLSHFFPLGTVDTKTAAEKAQAIYEMVTAKGWDTATEHFAREVTLAIHWVLNPVAWTYTTFYTEPRTTAPVSGSNDPASLPVSIVEGDPAIRRALQHWISLHPGVRLAGAFANPEELFHRRDSDPKELWLVNRTLPGMSGNECLERMKRLTPNLSGLIYSVYEDSNELFLATPGGATAYLLKRTPPGRFLEPITAQLVASPVSAEEILARVRNYFEGSLAFGSAGESTRQLETLTTREHEILAQLSKGYLDKEIAGRLNISAWTVRGHLKNIFEKLGVHTRTEAVVKFLHK